MIRNYTKSVFSKGVKLLKNSVPVTLFIALAVPSFAQIDPINFSSTAIATGSSPNELAIADFDGDGLDDIALCNTGLEEVVVYGNSSSTSSLSFTAAAGLTMTDDPVYVTVVDLNNDGLPDLVAAGTDNFDGTHSIKAFLNTSAGSGSFSFSAGQSYEVSSIPNHVEAADMDGDGLDDIVVTVGVSNHFSIFRNLSSGSTVSFATRFDVSTSNTYPNDLALSDLDLNGKTDILIVNSSSDNIEIFRNNSTVGTLDFTSITQYATGSSPWHMVVDDFNADGYEDVAVSLLGTNSIRVFGNLASGPGSLILGDVFDVTTSAATRWITSGDLNNDGRPEIVAADNNGNIISVFENTTLDNASTSSAITFSTVSELSAENKPRGIQVADLTGNGVNDIVVVSNTTGNLLVLENSLPVAEELLVYYPFNNNGLDESGNGNDVSVATNITYVADRFDNGLSALSLNGSTSYMRGDATGFPLGTAHRTIAGWMKLDATSASPDIMMVYGDNVINGGVFGLGANAQKAWLWGHNADLTGSTTMNLGEWYFVAATYDGSEAVLYLNGIEEARGNLDLNTLSTSVFDIGANTIEGWYAPASLDEIQLFSYALSPSDILSLYETGSLFDEVAIYLFDGDASDGTGNGNDGDVNGATLSVDRFGNADAAYTFDGSSNYINTAQTFTNNQPFSASTWVYWDGNTGRHTALSWFEGSLSFRMYLGVTEAGNLAFGDGFETGTPLEAGKWVHLVGTYDGNQSRLYIDGIESDVSITGLSYQFNTLTIGRQGTASSEYWDGKIDDIRIYDYALDASEVSELYGENGYADPRDILMDFYNSTNGDNWVDNTYWGTDAPLDDWYGVDTNEGVVTTLSLAANNLTGTLPASLGSLVSLDYLLLFNNAITGTIPPEYGNLTKATYFNISLNQLSGTIPAELAYLTSCNIFSLSRNQLTGDIPAGFASWTNTAGGGIYLYTNQLTGLPDLSGLPAGTTLSIYDNQIGFEDFIPNVALNSSGSALYASPQTVGDPVSLEPTEGEELTLSAIESASGTQYQWYYNDEIIEGANLIDHVFNFTSSVEGEYYCVMTNDNAPDIEIRRANYSISDGVNAAPSVITMEFYGLDNAAANNLPVAGFSTEDVDPGESHTFELVAGEGDTNNDLFVMDGVTLRVAGNIDATAVEYSIRVRVTDNGGASLEEIFLLEITPSHGCTGGVFTDASGTISDGSGVYRYNADFTCDWLIQYPDKSRVLLEFTEFDTEFNYDFLYIYDGENDQAPLLAVLSGSDIPAPVQSGSESVYIRFVSDEYITAGGWSLNYSELGPVAYYPFDGNGLDMSGNGWDGIVNGPTLVNDRFGNSESAYFFNGIDNYIQSGATLTDNAPFSISAWVKWDNATSDYRTIVSWWNAGASGNTYLGTTAGSNELRFGDTWVATGAYLDYGRWVHVVATYDGSNSTIYLDGEYINSSSGNSYGFAGGDLYIGRQGTQNGEYWTNRMDDVLIYDFALSEENVASLYEEGSTDLLAYLPFTSDLSDATDNGFDAYELGSGNGLTTDRFALDGFGVGAYNFDYINASPLELSNTINYDFGSEITVTAWIKPNSFPAADVSIVKNVMNGQGFDLRLSTGDLDPGVTDYTRRVFGDVTGISYGDAGEVYLGNWAHVAFTYSSNGGVRIYVNGQVLVNYGFVEGTEGSAIPVSEGAILIGDGFDGIIDEVQIHNSALSDEEIREVYSEKLWPFEAQALRGPEDVGGDAVQDLFLEPVGERYVGALDLLAGTYHFRLTDFDDGLPESFMGDNELDGVADAGGSTITLAQGLYAVGLWESSLAYYAEPITSVGIIGSALTGDNTGWNDDIDLTEMGFGIYQIKNIKLYDGEWKLRVNDTWNYLDWGYLSDGQLEYFGANFFIEAGTYTLTVDVVNSTYELIETSWGNWDVVAELYFDGDLTDDSGYGNDGTSASVNYGTDRYGHEESTLNLASTELVNLGAASELYLSNGFTMNIWLNPTINDNAGTIFHSVGSFHNHIYPTEFSWRYFQNAVEIGIEAIPIEAPTGQWTMMTWVYDGGEMRFYDDGVLVHTEPVYGDIDITGNAYEIGNSYDGYVDDFMWIDGVLSDEEIKGLYNDHLWLYYPLNASATDESGNGYNGILNGAIGDFDRFGGTDQALYFDGASDVDAPALPIAPDEITVSGWFNSSSLVTGSQQIIDLEGVAALALYDDDQRYFQGILNLGGEYIVLSAPVTSDEWHFGALTYDEQFFRLYLDGELVDEVYNTNQILYEADEFEVRLGRFDYTEGNYYTGAADDMRIYGRALSDEEIYELYGDLGWLIQQTGILADYPFEGDANDVSGQLNDGQVLGAEPTYDRFGEPNAAFSFNGVDSYIELPEVDYFGSSDQLTVSWWVNPANTSGVTGVLNFGNMLAQVIDGVLYTNLYFSGSGDVVGSTSLNLDEWQHLTLTYDGVNTRLYKNGSEVGVTALSGAVDSRGSGTPSTIGTINGSADFFDGDIDDIKVYNRPLSASEVDELYRTGGFPFGGVILSSLSEDFESECLPASWTEYNEGLDLINCGTNASNDTYVNMNGYAVGSGESWLITPMVDFNAGSYYQFSVEYSNRFSGPDVEVLYSMDYTGVPNPTSFTWINLTEIESAVNVKTDEGVIANTGDILLPTLDGVASIAFRYTADGPETGQSISFSLDDVIIAVTTVNQAPSALELSSTSVDENESIGTEVGVFTTTDSDSDIFTYSLVSGVGSEDNASFEITGDQLLTLESFDFETKSSYSIRVSTQDADGGVFEQAFTITINDILESSPQDPYAIEWIQKNTPYIGHAQYLNDELVTSVDIYTNYARYQTLIKLSDDGEVAWVSDSIKYIDDPNYYLSHFASDDNGNIYALGHLRDTLEINGTRITSNDGANGDLIILKYNAAGEIVENAIIGGDGVENQYGFVVLPSGNLLLSFYFDQFFSFQGKNFDNGISSRALLELDESLNATATSVVHPDNYGALVLTNEDRLFMTNHGRNAINEFSLTDYSVIATYQLPEAYECYDHTNQMVADGNGDLIFTGIEYTSGSSTSVNNIFAGKFNTGTNTWDWNYIMGSTGGNDEPVRLDVDGDNNVYLAGHYRFSWSVGGVGLPSATLQDIFLAKVNVSGSVLWVQTYGSSEDDYMQALAVDKTNNEVFLTAGFNGAGATVLSETMNNPMGIWLKLSPLGGDGPVSVSSIDGFGTYAYNEDQGAGFFNDSFDNGIVDNFTVEALVKYDGFDGPEDWYNQFVSTQFFTIYVDYDEDENINLHGVQINLPGQSLPDEYFVGGYVDVEDFGPNTWHHIALAYGGGTITFFLDGNVFRSYIANYDPADGVDDFLHLLKNVSGEIDEVRIWNEKRSLDEIRANIQNEIEPSSAGLVGYWPMNTKADDGSGSYTPDVTSNAQHLFLDDNADILELNLEPTDILLSSNSVKEGLDINTVVGTLSTTDGNATDSHTYSLVSGTGDVDNARFNISGNELRTSEIFTYTGQTYQIRIQTEDAQGATYQEIFFIGVDQNLNNAPTITSATFDIDENPSNGDIVSDAIEFEDVDGDDLTFSITAGNSSGAFAIGSSDGVLTVADASLFDYESISPKFYTIEITVSDAIESSFASFTINVNNVEEAAIFSNFDAPDSYDTGNGGFTVSADVEDPDGLTQVQVFYKKASESDFNVKSMTDNAAGNYSAAFSGAEIGLISIEYYIETTDVLSNQSQSATKTTSVNRNTSVALDVDNLAGITSGTTVEAYSILAFPFSGATVNGVFTNLMPYDEEKWRLVSYSSSGYSDKKSGGLTAGTGYFFITSESADIDVSGRSVVLDNGVYKINLSPDANGWSLIGNPFQGELDWSAVVQHNIDNAIISTGEVQTSLQGYNGQFRSQNSLSILEGAFVNSSGSITGFEIPATAVTEASGGRVVRTVNAPDEVYIDELDWSLDLFFETPSYKYSVGGIGINPDAADDRDYHDLAQLPRFSTYLDLTFDDGSTRSIKQTDEFKSWEFRINNSLPEKYIDMTWDIPVSSSRTIILVDAASRQIYDLSEVRNVKIANDPSAKHQLYYGDKDEIFENMDLPFDALFNLYPNPVRDYLNLELYASDNKNVTIEFVAIDGKVAYTEVLDLQRGLTRKQINLVGKNVPEGVYLIKVDTEVLSKFIKQ